MACGTGYLKKPSPTVQYTAHRHCCLSHCTLISIIISAALTITAARSFADSLGFASAVLVFSLTCIKGSLTLCVASVRDITLTGVKTVLDLASLCTLQVFSFCQMAEYVRSDAVNRLLLLLTMLTFLVFFLSAVPNLYHLSKMEHEVGLPQLFKTTCHSLAQRSLASCNTGDDKMACTDNKLTCSGQVVFSDLEIQGARVGVQAFIPTYV